MEWEIPSRTHGMTRQLSVTRASQGRLDRLHQPRRETPRKRQEADVAGQAGELGPGGGLKSLSKLDQSRYACLCFGPVESID